MKQVKSTHRSKSKPYPIKRTVTHSGGKGGMGSHATHSGGSKKHK